MEKPPELPESCELITERVGGEDVGQQKLAGAGAGSLPDIRYSPTFSNALTAWAYFDDPNVYPKTTVALGGAMLEAMGAARSTPIPMPALVIHGAEDTLVPTRFSEPLGDLPGVTRITFPEFRHESFNEDGGAVALATVTTWIDEQLAQAAS